jgi:RNA-directed DNA polymerase
VKVFSHEKKIKLISKLNLDGKAKLIRRVYISRFGTKKIAMPPLDMITIEDRAKQMLAKIALEPEWEAKFESNSYGFRPGRSSHDAIAAIFLSLRGKSRFVLEADLSKCFDELDNTKILRKLKTFEQMEAQIKSWLQADIMVGYQNKPDEINKCLEDTLQEEIISPLLANILLHGLENYIKDWYKKSMYLQACYPISKEKRDRRNSIMFSRYADNFIFLASSVSDIVEIEKKVNKWLRKEVGLSLFKVKTNIVNSTVGFEFLGFEIISIKSAQSGKYNVKITPSKKSKVQIISSTRSIIQSNKSASSYSLIVQLSGRILGWANYFRYSECQTTFLNLDYQIFGQIRAWVFRRKSKGLSSSKRLKEKYFPSGNTYSFQGKKYQNNWILVGKTSKTLHGKIKENYLPKMSWVISAQLETTLF